MGLNISLQDKAELKSLLLEKISVPVLKPVINSNS